MGNAVESAATPEKDTSQTLPNHSCEYTMKSAMPHAGRKRERRAFASGEQEVHVRSVGGRRASHADPSYIDTMPMAAWCPDRTESKHVPALERSLYAPTMAPPHSARASSREHHAYPLQSKTEPAKHRKPRCAVDTRCLLTAHRWQGIMTLVVMAPR